MKLILASGSKQRQDIFDMIGLKYDVIISDAVEESSATTPHEYVMELARMKAINVSKKVSEGIIVSADTIVYMDGKVYEKPKTKTEAFNNIKEMAGKTSYVYTGCTIVDLYQNKESTSYDVCKVFLNDVSDSDIRWYVDNQECILEHCGYSILGKAAIFLDKVEGDFNTLIGISPSKVYNELMKLGYAIGDFELQ